MDVSLHFRAAALGAALLAAGALGPVRGEREPEWVGARRLRLLVEVRPEPLKGRAGDERPARVALDFERLLAQAGITETADLSTLQVMRYDAATGKPVRYDNNLFAETPYDLPLQWYDAAIPDPFPDRDWGATPPWTARPSDPYPDRTRLDPWTRRPRWGYYYEVIGDWKAGQLAWTHVQEGDRPSRYAVYFDTLPSGAEPSAPRGWIGDGSHRTARVGRHSTGLLHGCCRMADLDRDGLLDLACGSSRGGVLWYRNLGTAQKPRFSVAAPLPLGRDPDRRRLPFEPGGYRLGRRRQSRPAPRGQRRVRLLLPERRDQPTSGLPR